MGQGIDRGQLEEAVRSRLSEYGIAAKNIYVDNEMRMVVVLCTHITGRMKLFLSDGAVSLGGFARDTMVSAHRVKVGGQSFGMMIIYCKKCFESGLKLLLGEG